MDLRDDDERRARRRDTIGRLYFTCWFLAPMLVMGETGCRLWAVAVTLTLLSLLQGGSIAGVAIKGLVAGLGIVIWLVETLTGDR